MTAPNPHDLLFRATFENLDHARSELAAVLPHEVLTVLDLSQLTLCSGTFIHPELKGSQSDLLYRTQSRLGDCLLYLLFEHESRSERFMLLRLLSYMVQIWQRELASQPGLRYLPPIVPVVLHHSKRGWTAATKFSALFRAPAELNRYIPQFELLLDDISKISNEQLALRNMAALARLVLFALRDSRKRDFMRHFARWAAPLEELVATEGQSALIQIFFEYMLQMSNLSVEELAHQVRRTVGPNAEQFTMNTKQQLINQGRLEGLSQGRAATLLDILRLRFGDAVTQHVEKRLYAANPQELEEILARLLSAQNIEQVFCVAADKKLRPG